MDVTSGLSASQKALDTIRSLPIWLLTALFASAALVWLAPQVRGDVPESMARWLPLAVIVLSVVVLCRLGAELLAGLANRRKRRIEQDRVRLTVLYRPLAAFFLTCHVTTSTGIAAPRFRHRWANAIEELSAYRRRRVGISKAWRALFDRQSSTSAEVEYGGEFPTDQILKLVLSNAKDADPALLNLFRRADRSRYQEPKRSLLTDEEYALFQHIHVEHERLLRRVA